ncbi:MAG TPA: GNAT family N-acetyltransferase [Chloroflexi bacterium]|nr:GNAT family N-acetyltransferase [Chloroflexota bacterium]
MSAAGGNRPIVIEADGDGDKPAIVPEYRRLRTADEYTALVRVTWYSFNSTDGKYPPITAEPWPGLEHYWGAFLGTTLVAGVEVFPVSILLAKIPTKCAFIHTVVSSPGTRGQGHARRLMSVVLNAYRHTHPLSTLFPFKYGFYARMGYTAIDDHQVIVFKPEDVNLPRGDPRTHTLTEVYDNDKKIAIGRIAYRSWRENLQVCLERSSPNIWKELSEGNLFYQVVNDESGHVDGYMIFQLAHTRDKMASFSKAVHASLSDADFVPGVMVIYEAVWLTSQAKRSIYKFIASHRDQVAGVVWYLNSDAQPRQFLKNHDAIAQCVSPGIMGRILDVGTILHRLAVVAGTTSLRDGSLWIEVTENPLMEDTPIHYMVTCKSGQLTATSSRPIPGGLTVSLDIGQLTSLALGYRAIDRLGDDLAASIPARAMDLFRVLFPKRPSSFPERV